MMDYKIKPVNEMTIDELIGQVIMIGLPGVQLDNKYLDFIKEFKIHTIPKFIFSRFTFH